MAKSQGVKYVAPHTSLIGRENEVVQLMELLRSGEVRLVTLTGPGGVGKTRLAQVAEALQAMRAEYPDEVCLVELAPVTDPDQVVPTIARTLGVREAPGMPLFATLKEHLRDKRLLLVLDNFEQVMTARHLIEELLQTCPQLKVLVTSRSPLQLPSEYELAISPLTLPESGRPLSVDDQSRYGAIALFVQRASEVKHDFKLTERNAEAIGEVCRRIDGLPLAIELVAAHARLLPPQAILARLQHPLELLAGRTHDPSARHTTMRNTIEWSYKLLDEREQRLFRRLSVFMGGCSLRAAEAVCNEAGDISIESAHPHAIEVLKGVEGLVDKSLLRYVEQREDEEPRLTMLETVREYALEQLLASGEADTMRRRHADYYLALAERLQPELRSDNVQTWMGHLSPEHDNLRAALRWLLQRDQVADYEAALRLILDLQDFWGRQHHTSEVQQWLEIALTRSERRATLLRLKALRYISTLVYAQADYSVAQTWAEDALAVARELNNEPLIASSLNHIGLMAIFQGKYEQARTLLEESLDIFQRAGNDVGVGAVYINLGEAVRYQGDYAQAEAYYRESLRVFTALGSQLGILQALSNIGHMAYMRGDLPSARATFVEALALAHETDARKPAAEVLTGMSSVIMAEVVSTGNEPNISSQSLRGVTQATHILGTTSAIVERSGRQMEPIDQEEFDRNVASARAIMGEKMFTAAWEKGRAMTLAQALELVKRGQRRARGRAGPPATGGLTTREVEVAALVAGGMSNEAIAQALVLSERTIEMHVSHALHKLGLTTRTQLAAWAVRNGLQPRVADQF
jgi:predicted ATPase/DNA-binding CsgD family transcriptional regulator